jgi:release factor glutamine methyltransferase
MSRNIHDRPHTGEQALRYAVCFLEQKGFEIEQAKHEARLLLAKAWQKEIIQVLLDVKSELDQATWEKFALFVKERGSFTPLHYLLEEKEFMSLPFKVSTDVLIPRWDTEVLAEEALKLLKDQENPKILDLGTGSGVIAISIAYYLPQAEVVATDISAEALKVAWENAQNLGVSERVRFLQGSLYTPLIQAQVGKFDLIASNPPYLSAEEMAALPADVKREPAIALAGGKDGLQFYRAIALQAKKYLASGGHVLVEIGYQQAMSVIEIMQKQGLTPLRILRDLEGRNRVVAY